MTYSCRTDIYYTIFLFFTERPLLAHFFVASSLAGTSTSTNNMFVCLFRFIGFKISNAFGTREQYTTHTNTEHQEPSPNHHWNWRLTRLFTMLFLWLYYEDSKRYERTGREEWTKKKHNEDDDVGKKNAGNIMIFMRVSWKILSFYPFHSGNETFKVSILIGTSVSFFSLCLHLLFSLQKPITLGKEYRARKPIDQFQVMKKNRRITLLHLLHHSLSLVVMS